MQNFAGGGGWGANKVHYEKPSRCPGRCCCCLSSAISTVDNRTLIRESDSKATGGELEIVRNCILVRTVYMTHSSLVKQSIYFSMYYFRCFLG